MTDYQCKRDCVSGESVVSANTTLPEGQELCRIVPPQLRTKVNSPEDHCMRATLPVPLRTQQVRAGGGHTSDDCMRASVCWWCWCKPGHAPPARHVIDNFSCTNLPPARLTLIADFKLPNRPITPFIAGCPKTACLCVTSRNMQIKINNILSGSAGGRK